jgi:hypothetical protein
VSVAESDATKGNSRSLERSFCRSLSLTLSVLGRAERTRKGKAKIYPPGNASYERCAETPRPTVEVQVSCYTKAIDGWKSFPLIRIKSDWKSIDDMS